MLVEFLRIKGDLLLALSPDNIPEAETLYLQALDIAQGQEAKMLELRTAISLALLWQETDKAEQGRRLLSTVYQKFSEGFATADLIEAKDILGLN